MPVGSPFTSLAGAWTIPSPCIAEPRFLVWKVTLPALTVGVGVLIHMSPIVTCTMPLPAAGACDVVVAGLGAAATFGAPLVCRMPAAPFTMSPNEWVTKG